jgi:hypothetical protein
MPFKPPAALDHSLNWLDRAIYLYPSVWNRNQAVTGARTLLSVREKPQSQGRRSTPIPVHKVAADPSISGIETQWIVPAYIGKDLNKAPTCKALPTDKQTVLAYSMR